MGPRAQPQGWPNPFSSRLKLRHAVTVYVGEPITGEATSEQLYQRVLELGTRAAECRKSPASTLSHRPVEAAKSTGPQSRWRDSTGGNSASAKPLTAALPTLKVKWVLANRIIALRRVTLFPSSVGGALANLGVTLTGKTAACHLNFTSGEEAMAHAIQKCEISTVSYPARRFSRKPSFLNSHQRTVFLEDLLPTFTGASKVLTMLAARLLPARLLAGSHATRRSRGRYLLQWQAPGRPKGVMRFRIGT